MMCLTSCRIVTAFFLQMKACVGNVSSVGEFVFVVLVAVIVVFVAVVVVLVAVMASQIEESK